MPLSSRRSPVVASASFFYEGDRTPNEPGAVVALSVIKEGLVDVEIGRLHGLLQQRYRSDDANTLARVMRRESPRVILAELSCIGALFGDRSPHLPSKARRARTPSGQLRDILASLRTKREWRIESLGFSRSAALASSTVAVNINVIGRSSDGRPGLSFSFFAHAEQPSEGWTSLRSSLRANLQARGYHLQADEPNELAAIRFVPSLQPKTAVSEADVLSSFLAATRTKPTSR